MTRRRYYFDAETLGIKQRHFNVAKFDFTAVTQPPQSRGKRAGAAIFFSRDAFMLAMDSSTVIGTDAVGVTRGLINCSLADLFHIARVQFNTVEDGARHF